MLNISYKALLSFSLCLFIYSAPSFATGPRVAPSVFTSNIAYLYTSDFPPFISSKTENQGLLIEIINTVLKSSNITGEVNILPSKNMAKYYFSQENALAIIGYDFNFSKKTQQKSIFVPILSIDEYYYYHASTQQDLKWQGELSSLKNKVYGTTKGNNIAKYKAAGITIKYGRLHNLLQKMKNNQVDFIKSPQLTLNAALHAYFPQEQSAFIKMEAKAAESVLGITFNKQHADGNESAEKFKQGLQKIIASGEFNSILQGYLGNDVDVSPYLKHLK